MCSNQNDQSLPNTAHFFSLAREMVKKHNIPTDFEFTFPTKKTSVKSYEHWLRMTSPEMRKIVEESTDRKYLVQVDGVNQAMFEQFLEISPVNNVEFTVDDVIMIAQLGNTFCPKEARRLCKKLTSGRLTMGNAFAIKAKSRTHELSVLENVVAKFIRKEIHKNAEKFIENQDFIHLDAMWLVELLKSTTLKCSEETLLKHVYRWATANGSDNLGKQLQDIGYFARLQSMGIVQILSLFHDAGLANGVAIKLLANVEDWREGIGEEGNNLNLGSPPLTNSPSPPREPLTRDQFPPPGSSTSSPSHDPDHTPPPPPTQSESGNTSAGEIEGIDAMSFTSGDGNEAEEDSEATLSMDAAPMNENSWEEFRSKIALNLNCQSINAVVKILEPLSECGIPFAMPKLRDVKLELQIPDEGDDTPGIVEIRQSFYPKPYFFFATETLSSSGVDYELQINGVKFFKMSRARKELCIGFDGISVTPLINELLPLSRNFETLILSDLCLPNIQFPCQTLTQVMLWGVSVVDEKGQLGNFLQKFENLRHLTVWMKILSKTSKINKSKLNLETDLVSSEKLQKIAICMSQFVLSPLSDIDAVKKENITELYTDYCHWSIVIFDHFHKLFPNLIKLDLGSFCRKKYVEQVEVGTETNSRRNLKRRKQSSSITQSLVSAASIRLMTNLFKIKSLEWIRIEKLDWFAMPFTKQEKAQLLNFFKEAGLTIPSPVNFRLEKNRETGQWLGTQLKKSTENYQKKMNEVEFKNFELQRIFQDMACFDYYNVRL